MRETYDFMNFSYDTMKSAKLRGLHGLVGRVGPVGAWVRGCVGGDGQNLRGSRGLQGSINFCCGSISFLLGSNFCVGLNFYVDLKFSCVSKNFAWV